MVFGDTVEFLYNDQLGLAEFCDCCCCCILPSLALPELLAVKDVLTSLAGDDEDFLLFNRFSSARLRAEESCVPVGMSLSDFSSFANMLCSGRGRRKLQARVVFVAI